MKYLLALLTLVLLVACSTKTVRCDGKLMPINLPARAASAADESVAEAPSP